MDMSTCDRLMQVVGKTSWTARIEISVNILSALSQTSRENQGVKQVGKKGDRIYVLSQRVHENSCRAERGSGRDARTRRIVIG